MADRNDKVADDTVSDESQKDTPKKKFPFGGLGLLLGLAMASSRPKGETVGSGLGTRPATPADRELDGKVLNIQFDTDEFGEQRPLFAGLFKFIAETRIECPYCGGYSFYFDLEKDWGKVSCYECGFEFNYSLDEIGGAK